MMYNSLWGMNIVWWLVWVILIFWIFATPYDIPGQRNRTQTPFDILKRRLAAGKITVEEYQEKKKILETDSAKL